MRGGREGSGRTGEGARLDAVQRALPDLLFTFDRDGRFLEVQGSDALLAMPRPAFLGRMIDDVLPELASAAHAGLEAAFRTGEVQIFEYTVVVRGEPRRFEARISTIDDASAICVARDVTALQAMHARVAAVERMAALGTISATLAHEVAGPIAYVLGSLRELARQLPPVGGEPSTLLAAAIEGSERVAAIVGDLRNLSRPDGDGPPVADVHVAVERAIRIVASALPAGARVVRDFGDVPWVALPESRLGQVLLNVILNAAQALPRDASGEIRVATGLLPEGFVFVDVTDDGVGIAPDHRSLVFEPFFSTKGTAGGTGLGLWIARDLVGAVGGTLTLESGGPGTTFRLRLPPMPQRAE